MHVFGRYDRVITLKSGKKFQSRVREFSRLHVLEKGHKMANAVTGERVAVFLKDGDGNK